MEQAKGQRQLGYVAPEGACRILLIRHGESAPALEERPFPLLDGQGDPPLHDQGRRQAAAVADRLAGADLDAIYVSDLRRTGETAAPLASALGIVPRVVPRLREVHLGEWEGGIYRIRVAEGHPLVARVWAAQRWDEIPGAETNESLDARVARALEEIAAAHRDGQVAVFTHGGVIASALARATSSRPFAFLGADNASISRLVVSPDGWVLRCYNDTSHLGADGPAPGG